MMRSMSFIHGWSDTAYYSMDAGLFTGGADMTFGIICAVRANTVGATIQRFWGNWEDTGDTGWCVQKSAASIDTAAGQIWDLEAGAAGDTISNAAPAAPQSALYRPVFIVGTLDVTGDALTMFINGTEVSTDTDITPAAGGTIYLGRGNEAAVPGEDIKISTFFLHAAVLTDNTIADLFHEVERYGRIGPDTTIQYYWDVFDNPDPSATSGATWESRGAAATALTLTRGGTNYADLTCESWTNTGFAL